MSQEFYSEMSASYQRTIKAYSRRLAEAKAEGDRLESARMERSLARWQRALAELNQAAGR